MLPPKLANNFDTLSKHPRVVANRRPLRRLPIARSSVTELLRGTFPSSILRGSLAMPAAILLASSLVMRFAAVRRPGSDHGEIFGVADDVGDAAIFLDCPWRREAALGHDRDLMRRLSRRPGRRAWCDNAAKYVCRVNGTFTVAPYDKSFHLFDYVRKCHQAASTKNAFDIV